MEKHSSDDTLLTKTLEANRFYQRQLSSSKEEITSLKNRIAWFENQMFGQKSEKRIIDNPYQASLLSEPTETEMEAVPEKKVNGYKRGTAKKARNQDCITDNGLRFSDEVPIEKIDVIPVELSGPDADQYEIIDTKITRKLAQKAASFVVLEYHLPVLKKKVGEAVAEGPELITTAMPEQVLEGSIADVSLIVGLLINKFLYHLPLHRQHQQLTHNGITVARSSLTNWTKRGIELLRPIVEAQLLNVLQSKVLAMDETPIKAGRQQKAGRKTGKMKSAYFWPVYGEDDEVVFTFSESRGKQHIIDTLSNAYSGTLVTDGYAAYARYAEKTDGVIHAQCWVHARRYLVNAQESSPKEIDTALELIGQLYQVEKQIREQNLSGEKKRKLRLDKSKPKVDDVFAWIDSQCQRYDLTPKHPLTKALKYIKNRETELRVFLADPDVPMDTNHLEREIRPIPMGRKAWLFCWSELGAEHVGLIQSLISTCKLHDINPHTYLTDVLQRVSDHPMSKIEELTPRLWKGKFAGNPMRSVLYKPVNHVVE
jgi:transposase